MKYLVILVLVLLAAWQWRNSRGKQIKNRSKPNTNLKEPQNMVVCAHCGVHLPAQDAVPGNRGQYCDARHRTAAEH